MAMPNQNNLNTQQHEGGSKESRGGGHKLGLSRPGKDSLAPTTSSNITPKGVALPSRGRLQQMEAANQKKSGNGSRRQAIIVTNNQGIHARGRSNDAMARQQRTALWSANQQNLHEADSKYNKGSGGLGSGNGGGLPSTSYGSSVSCIYDKGLAPSGQHLAFTRVRPAFLEG